MELDLRVLKAPKCRSLRPVEGGGRRPVKLSIKVGKSAHGAYKIRFAVKGVAGKPARAKIVVR
jgi:hypothetical protein